ncbi:MAG TPA: right-handed parallel beta-helix repeat-containing protein [Bryobacteraceae bacterium]|nr:right-handed parallel beta-helix repeat-containing protein [Bryobacteraceae bacterium]
MSFWRRGAPHALNVIVLCGLAVLFFDSAASAATLCVNPSGASGCYSTIGAAVKAASAGDLINIGTGQYAEDVVISKPLALVGSGASSTIINARGLANGIYVDGLDNGGLSGVLVTGLTVTNANYEGILVTNTINSVISNNHVANNDVELNSGGILLSDETGETFENLITGNSVHDNALDCGITLASHPPSPQASSKLPYGVVSNNIVGNNVSRNGIAGEGAGIGVFAPGPGNVAFENKIIGNVILDNGLPGVTVHNHAAPPGAPGVNLNDLVILGNYISGNGADVQDSATPGTAGINIYAVAPIYATQILENTIENEALDVVINNPGGSAVHLNNLLGGAVGVANLGTGTVDATLNYFGCASGPGTTGGCSSVSGKAIGSTPFLASPVPSAPAGPSGGRGPM